MPPDPWHWWNCRSHKTCHHNKVPQNCGFSPENRRFPDSPPADPGIPPCGCRYHSAAAAAPNPAAQTARLWSSLWLKSGLNKKKSLHISTELSYKYNLLISNGTTSFSNIVDLNLLQLSGHWAFGRNNLFVDIGRFPYSDISGSVFSQKSDGLSVRFGNMSWNAGLYAGYTGGLNRFTVGMTDILEPKMEQFYDLCYGYVPILADFSLSARNNNSFTFQLGYFLDVTTGKNSKEVFEFAANGPLGYIGNYSFNLAASSENFKNLMIYSNFDFSFYLLNNLILSFGADYTSGDHGFLGMFVPVTYKTIHNSQSVIFGADVIVPRLTGIFVIDKLCITANEKVVLSLPKKGFTLNGLDTSISAVYNIFSDLQVSCMLNAYVDLVNKDFNNYNFTLNAGFAF